MGSADVAWMHRRAPTRSGLPLSAGILVAFDHELARLGGGGSPADVMRRVTVFLAAMSEELERVAALRGAAVLEARRDGASYETIADAAGLSKARVAQLVRAARDSPVEGRPGRAGGWFNVVNGVEVYTAGEVPDVR